MKLRQTDVEILQRALELPALRDDVRSAFEDMLAQEFPLTAKQIAWVKRELDEPEYENLISSGKAPRGREVPTPAVLQNLPKFPPGRKINS